MGEQKPEKTKKHICAGLLAHVDPEKKQAIDHVFMALTGYMLETLISMSV